MHKRGFLASIGGLNILLLGLVSMLNDISSEMIQPLLPLLISAIGGTGLTLGLIGGIIEGLPNIIKVGVGYFSDKIRKRKRFIFGGYFFTQASKLGIALANNAAGLAVFIGFDKIGKGIREPPRDALISESLPKEKGKAFGMQRAFDRGGAIIGSILALVLVILLSSKFKQIDLIKLIIFIGAVIGFTSLMPLIFVKELNIKKNKTKIKFFSIIKNLSKPLVLFILIASIFALANFSYLFFVFKASKIFRGEQYILPVIPILLYAVYNIIYSLTSIPFGKFSDMLGRKKVIITGYGLFAAVCLGFLFANSLSSYVVLFILYGLSSAMVFGNQNAMVSDLSTKKLRATSLGVFQAVIGFMAIISNIVAGILFDLNSSYMFLFGALLSLTSVIVFMSFGKYFKKIENLE